MSMWIEPSSIKFSQDSISSSFSNGWGSVFDLFDSIYDGQVDADSVKNIVVTGMNGQWYVRRGNRRLYVMRKLESCGKVDKIFVRVQPGGVPENRLSGDGDWPKVNGPKDDSSWWASFSDSSIQESFLNSSKGDVECLAINHNSCGYLYVSKNGKYKYNGVSNDVHEKIEEGKRYGVELKYASLGPNGTFFIKYSDNSSYFEVGSNLFRKNAKKYTVDKVTFGPDDAFWAEFDDGTTLWENLPPGLSLALRDSTNTVEDVALSPSGGWLLIEEDFYRSGGIPIGMLSCIDKSAARGVYPYRASFGYNDDWVIEFQ